jgi:prohibitin 2
LQAEGEAQAITIIDQQLRNNPTYLEWLKATKWDGVLPLVTGGGGQGVTPFIEIPTSRGEEETQTTVVDNSTTTSATPASSIQTRLNPLTEQ